eukprot:1186622-Prorocentrum_minimum.AAC.2
MYLEVGLDGGPEHISCYVTYLEVVLCYTVYIYLEVGLDGGPEQVVVEGRALDAHLAERLQVHDGEGGNLAAHEAPRLPPHGRARAAVVHQAGFPDEVPRVHRRNHIAAVRVHPPLQLPAHLPPRPPASRRIIRGTRRIGPGD